MFSDNLSLLKGDKIILIISLFNVVTIDAGFNLVDAYTTLEVGVR
jgi:hypothetical protein